MINRHILFPSLVIIISSLLLVGVTQFQLPLYQDAPVGAGFFPTVVAIIQILICAVLIIQHKNKKHHKKEEPLISKKSIFGIVYLIAYTVLISVIGYLFASLISFTFYLVYFKIKKPLYYVIAWVFVFTIYYIFGEVFYIALPEGLLFY